MFPLDIGIVASQNQKSLYWYGYANTAYQDIWIVPVSDSAIYITSGRQNINKVDSFGKSIWTKTLSSSFTGLVADSSENLYLAHKESSAIGITKLDSSGAIVWQYKYSIGSILGDTGDAGNISIDSSGNIYVAVQGDYDNPNQEQSGTYPQPYVAFLLKVNSSGTLQWMRQYGDSLNDSIGSISAPAIDASGNIYLAMTRSTALQLDYDTPIPIIAKYNSSGTLQDTLRITPGEYSYVSMIKYNPIDGNLYMSTIGSSGSYLYKVSTGLSISFIRKLAGSYGYTNSIAFDASGNIHGFRNYDGASYMNQYYKYNTSGTILDQKTFVATNKDLFISRISILSDRMYLSWWYGGGVSGCGLMSTMLDSSMLETFSIPFSSGSQEHVIATSSLTESLSSQSTSTGNYTNSSYSSATTTTTRTSLTGTNPYKIKYVRP